MRILICGGRTFANQEKFERAMEPFAVYQDWDPTFTVIHGAARGADAMADRWALVKLGLQVDKTLLRFPADWDKCGPAAGPIRNERMLLDGKPDWVIAFPGGPGTRNMVELTRVAIRAGVKITLAEIL